MVKKQGYTIAMAGKGGTGKTTLAGLLVRFLKEPCRAIGAFSERA
jgi:CO dehydrogenase nickel-insertion accessory protein CooC1